MPSGLLLARDVLGRVAADSESIISKILEDCLKSRSFVSATIVPDGPCAQKANSSLAAANSQQRRMPVIVEFGFS